MFYWHAGTYAITANGYIRNKRKLISGGPIVENYFAMDQKQVDFILCGLGTCIKMSSD